jgi:Lon protease-like protein
MELGAVPNEGGTAGPNDTRVMPMFPLGTVLFPYALLPLQVFEPRYRVMMHHVLEGDREFGVVLIERGSEVGGGDARFDVATVARVVQAAELPDGRYALATVGTRRVRVGRWLEDDPYPRAEVVALDDPPARAADADARARVVEALDEVIALARRVDGRVADAPTVDADPVRAAYEVAALAPIGPLDAQRVLATAGLSARLQLLETLLNECATDLRARFDLDE